MARKEERKDPNAPRQFDKKGPQHDWVVASVDEDVRYTEQVREDGTTRRVRKRKVKRTYKEDTGEVTRHCCTIS